MKNQTAGFLNIATIRVNLAETKQKSLSMIV